MGSNYRAKMVWTPAEVGCYWTCGSYRISSFMEIEGGKIVRSGYRLYHKRVPLEDFEKLVHAQLSAEQHWLQRLRSEGSAA
jgi:hypothetical protein